MPLLSTHDSGSGLTIGSLCSGYAGLDMGAAAALGGARLCWTADSDPDITRLLAARFPGVPNLGDLASPDWSEVERVDVITAGFPCQDISAAGRGAGIEKGARSSVWNLVVEAVRRLRPRLLLVENVAALRWKGRGLDRVLADLARTGYDTQWCSVRASDIGAPHRRERVFLAAHPMCERRSARPGRPASPPCARSAGAAERCGLPPQPRTHLPGCGLRPRTRGSAEPAAHSAGQRRHQGQPEPHGLQGRPHPARSHCAAEHSRTRANPRTRRSCPERSPSVDRGWGRYAAAICRWEHVLGRPAPAPTEPGRAGRPRLSPRFVEWMQGLQPGWATDPELGLSRAAQLRALGNGVVPQQAAYGIARLLAGIAAADQDGGRQ
ncbi:DNA cytosine methyltransferase [Murinocardiopsis flavida]|nr:DNA cytosine methyltransferase [Murinocardiopsis flavida]